MSDVIELSSDGQEHLSDKEEMKPKKDVKKRKRRSSGEYDTDSGNILKTFKNFLVVCHDIEVKRRNGGAASICRINDKLLSRFRVADPEYTRSDTFKEALSSASKLVETDPSNLFVHMKHIGDELKIRSKKGRKRKLSESGDGSPKKHQTSEGKCENNDNDSGVNLSHLNKLEVIFHKVYRKVKHLEEKEVDFDEEEESSYLQLERYKKRLYTIWEKWQEVSGHMDEVKKMKNRKVAFSGTQYADVNHAIEKFVNRTKVFPDYLDIYNLTEESLKKENGGEYTADQIRGIATAAFQSLGNQLQKMRVYDFWNSCQTYLSSTASADPADKDENLAKALNQNQTIYKKKLCEVIEKFADKQVVGKLEPEEVLPGMEVASSQSSEDGEEPEEIIYISSSSQGSHDGVESEEEHINGNFGNCANGNLEESSNHSKNSDSKLSNDKFDLVKDGIKVNISLETNPNKQRKGCEEEKPTTSGSISHSIKTERLDSYNEVHEHVRKTKSTAVDVLQEIVILSESDSGE